jgi:hypothetical protein
MRYCWKRRGAQQRFEASEYQQGSVKIKYQTHIFQHLVRGDQMWRVQERHASWQRERTARYTLTQVELIAIPTALASIAAI